VGWHQGGKVALVSRPRHPGGRHDDPHRGSSLAGTYGRLVISRSSLRSRTTAPAISTLLRATCWRVITGSCTH
jgi:hypothetical protein